MAGPHRTTRRLLVLGSALDAVPRCVPVIRTALCLSLHPRTHSQSRSAPSSGIATTPSRWTSDRACAVQTFRSSSHGTYSRTAASRSQSSSLQVAMREGLAAAILLRTAVHALAAIRRRVHSNSIRDPSGSTRVTTVRSSIRSDPRSRPVPPPRRRRRGAGEGCQAPARGRRRLARNRSGVGPDDQRPVRENSVPSEDGEVGAVEREDGGAGFDAGRDRGADAHGGGKAVRPPRRRRRTADGTALTPRPVRRYS